jgi:hypothetical protein
VPTVTELTVTVVISVTKAREVRGAKALVDTVASTVRVSVDDKPPKRVKFSV